jgi:hypothetical protein
MRREVLIVLTLACLTVLGVVIVGRTVSAQGNAQAKGQAKKETPPVQTPFFGEQNSSEKAEGKKPPPSPPGKPTPSPSPYNPYPTYYYTVDSMEANGKGDGVKSTVKQFTTPGPGEQIVRTPK